MWFTCPHYIIHHYTASLHNTTIPGRDSLHDFCKHPSPYIYAAEVSAPGVNNMMGTMEWLWCLGVLHPMQFFHTLMPFRLSPSFLGRVRRVWVRRVWVRRVWVRRVWVRRGWVRRVWVRRVWVRREMVAMSMTMTTLLSAPSLSLSSPARVGRAWVRTVMVTTSMTMTLLLLAPSPLPSLLRAWPCATVRVRRGWAWARAMLRRRACRQGHGRGKGRE